MRAPSILARVLVTVAIGGWTTTAGAHPGFPAVVDGALGVPNLLETSFKPTGCQVCHTSSLGATAALMPFGTLLVSTYGLSNDPVNENDNSLKQAMIGLAADDPEAVADLKKGVDPSGDSAVFATALPQPQYGCAAVPAMGRRPPNAGLFLAIVTAVILFGRRRLRRSCLSESRL